MICRFRFSQSSEVYFCFYVNFTEIKDKSIKTTIKCSFILMTNVIVTNVLQTVHERVTGLLDPGEKHTPSFMLIYCVSEINYQASG